jgi:outer membrane protein OmpA-like peptidoglycan-associated protein/tetratricopeptide (TPR) repeat protein
MKSLVLFLCGIVITIQSFSQAAIELDKGDKAFDKMNYEDALFYFESALEMSPNDPNITRRIADTYRRMGLPAVSADWYKKTIENGSKNPDDLLYYAEALKSMGQYEEAVNCYSKYALEKPNDTRASSHILDKEYYLDLFADTLKYEMRKLQINNADPVMGIAKYGTNKFLVSAVNIEAQDNKKKSEPFLDIYEVTQNPNFEFADPRRLDKKINSSMHEVAGCYDQKSGTLYFTKTSNKKNKTGTYNLKIFRSKFADNKWSTPEELTINSEEFSNAHPCLSLDGQFLYFMSNRPGGFGGSDIYVCQKNGEGWDAPINLGANINTAGNEMFPYISNIGTLYFASDGHAGLGGLDIFFSEQFKGGWLAPSNMGSPINGRDDDFSLWYDDSADRGYFCSNRTGKGNDDFYFFQFLTLQQMILTGTVALQDPLITLEGENVQITATNRGEVTERKLDGKGQFQYIGFPGDHIEVKLTNDKIAGADKPIFIYDIPETIKDPYVNLGSKEMELKTKIQHVGPLSGYKEIALAKSSVTVSDIANDQTRASYNKLVSIAENKLLAKKYTEAKDLYTRASALIPEESEPTKRIAEIENIIAKNKAKEEETIANAKKETEKPNPGKGKIDFESAVPVIDLEALSLDDVFFDYNKSFIRESDKTKLYQVAQLLKENSDTKILIKAHCDSRGSLTYNQSLSMSRAMAIQGYLISKGVKKDRIQAEWYGEQRPLNGCVDEVPCEEDQYEINRRAEFKIIR